MISVDAVLALRREGLTAVDIAAQLMTSYRRVREIIEAHQPTGSTASLPSEFAGQLLALRGNLRRYALVLTRDRDRAEDLFQDSCVRALEKSARFVPGTDLRAWLFAIMHNLHVSKVRRAWREAKTVNAVDLAATGIDRVLPPPQEPHMMLRDMARLLSCLPMAQREVLQLASQGFTYGEIAAELGLPLGTVRSRMSRGRAVLREAAIGGICVRATWRGAR